MRCSPSLLNPPPQKKPLLLLWACFLRCLWLCCSFWTWCLRLFRGDLGHLFSLRWCFLCLSRCSALLCSFHSCFFRSLCFLHFSCTLLLHLRCRCSTSTSCCRSRSFLSLRSCQLEGSRGPLAFCLHQLNQKLSLQILLDEWQQLFRINLVIRGNILFYGLQRRTASLFQTLYRIPHQFGGTWMKTNQPTKGLRASTCAKRKSTTLGLYSHSCVNRIAGLDNRHLKL